MKYLRYLSPLYWIGFLTNIVVGFENVGQTESFFTILKVSFRFNLDQATILFVQAKLREIPLRDLVTAYIDHDKNIATAIFSLGKEMK